MKIKDIGDAAGDDVGQDARRAVFRDRNGIAERGVAQILQQLLLLAFREALPHLGIEAKMVLDQLKLNAGEGVPIVDAHHAVAKDHTDAVIGDVTEEITAQRLICGVECCMLIGVHMFGD